MKELLKLNNVMYQLPTGEELWEIKNLSVHMGDKIGLIGKNGSGKTSLFDCIVGVKDFSGGSHSVTPNLFYIPQQKDKNLDDLSVQELLDTHKINTAAFLSVTTKEFEFSSDFINKKINTLSGGEYVKLYITIASLKKPALLLLDEPTNHLDTDGINFLVNWLKMFNGAFICISHDTDFLNRTIKSIWEIENAKINVFGGNYFKYKEIKDLERQSILRKIEVKEKEIKKVKKSVQIEQARQQRSIREGNVQKFDRSMEKAAIGYFKEQAQKSASKNTNRLSGLLEDKENELSELSLNKTQKIRLKINGEGEGYTIFNIENTNLYLGNIIFIQDINIKVVSGDRIRIKGKNGSGKSILLKSILGANDSKFSLRDGKFYSKSNLKVVYLDQFYNILNDEQSVLENVLNFSKDIQIEDARKQLSNLLFKDNLAINKKVKFLSGGEKVRLLVAMITISPIDLLILDEPTNNLDIDSIEVFSQALQDFNGAVILVTHNESFAKDLNIDKEYIIKDHSLTKII